MMPLTPPDCDLKDFAFMPIEVSRFLDSSFNATLNDMAWRAGVTLWMKAWHQVPAASLPDDEATLANLAGLGRDVKTWRKIKDEAMRGWIKADDDLLYHPVVAEKALEAWLEKLSQRLSSGAGNATRWGASFDPKAIEAQMANAVALLSALNPNSKTLAKKRKKPSQKHPDGTVPGDEAGVPTGSQETLKGQGRDIEGSRVSSETLSPSGDSEAAKEITFEDFRQAYPKPDGLNAARADWDSATKAGANPQSILDGLGRWNVEWERRIADPKRAFRPEHIPNAGKWLAGKGWLDQAAAAIGGSVTSIARAWPPDDPCGIRAAVAAEAGDGAAASLIDPANWIGPKTVEARTGVARDRLRKLACMRPYVVRKAA